MNKRIVIVGASRGIGLSLAQMLTEGGDEVIALSRTVGGVENLQRLTHFEYDATSDTTPPTIDGPVDGFVYCPGSINLRPFNRLSEKDFVLDFEINLVGAVRTLQHFLPNLKESDAASVVLFSTVAVQTGMGFHASVSAAKGAVEGLTRSLAAEFAPKIRVNCIAPSLTDTPLAERLLKTPEQREASAARHPMKKIGTPEDIASLATFLLSDSSGWMTGQILHIDGGMSSVR